MLVPINWLNKYINLEHSLDEFGQVMTELEFMQDGPVKEVSGQLVIDLEVRQNRPDVFSIIGIAREYSAYINKPIAEPIHLNKTDLNVKWEHTGKLVDVQDKSNVKRFCAVKIQNLKIQKSPDWLIDDLNAYGIPAINNIVDITNYVMLEYGMPLHAFDFDKLESDQNQAILTLRKAQAGEEFKTWQDTRLDLTIKDLIISDSKKPIAIAGVIGGANSDIDDNTKTVLLESACYNQAIVRRTSARHNLRTEASSRHEKFLNPELCEIAILRALHLIQELSGGEIVQIDDYYDQKQQPVIIDFNLNEISRLGGIDLPDETINQLLHRLGFEILSSNDAIGLDKYILQVQVPNWRTDVTISADLVEEVLRLYGYDKIKPQAINVSPPDFATPIDLQVEAIIKQILIELGLDEHIVSPIVKFDKKNQKQIKLENPMSTEYEALRTTIRETLKIVGNNYIKFGREQFCIFESGKIYLKEKEGEYIEQKQIETLYYGYEFLQKVKPDFVALISRLGLQNSKLTWKKTNGHLEYFYKDIQIANLYPNGFIIYIKEISDVVDLLNIPFTSIKTILAQKIYEDISIIVSKNELLGKIADAIKNTSEYIKHVKIKDIYQGDKIDQQKQSVTFQVLFEDIENRLNRDSIETFKKEIIKSIKKFDAILRDF